MLKHLIPFLMTLIPMIINAQQFKGRVYGQEGALADVLISNKTKNKRSVTNDQGDFSIDALVGDSVVFKAAFYFSKTLKLTQEQVSQPWVVELKMDLNELDAVVVSQNPRPIAFEVGRDETSIKNAFLKEYNINPAAYGKGVNGNIGGLINLAAKIFKKEKPSKPSAGSITFDQFKVLFKGSTLFNDQLLSESFKIPLAYHDLFFYYCADRNIKAKLLAIDSQFILLDELVKANIEFQKVLQQYVAPKED